MNVSIGDGMNLGWKLAAAVRGEAGDALLASYEPERMAAADHILSLSDRVMDLETAPNPVLRFARTHLTALAARAISGVPPIGHRVAEFMSQLSIGYPDSPAVDTMDGASGLVAGERAPYGPLGDGRTTFDLFRGVDHHLLVVAGPGADAGLDRDVAALRAVVAVAAPTIHTTLVDPGQPLRERYDVRTPTAFPVRPDGHLGYRGRADQPRLLAAHLTRLYGARVHAAAV
jgi:hypothetical protein